MYRFAQRGRACHAIVVIRARDGNKPRLSRSDAADAQLKVRVSVKAGPKEVGIRSRFELSPDLGSSLEP